MCIKWLVKHYIVASTGLNETLKIIVASIGAFKEMDETNHTVAKEILQGKADLSRRTEAQARCLEKPPAV